MINSNQTKNFFNSFNKEGYVYVPGFFDEMTMSIVSNYAEFCLKRGVWNEYRDPVDVRRSKYAFYSDPLMETLLLKTTETMSEITQKRLAPTYSYIRIYDQMDELEAHIDRDSCEYSATINAFSKKIWPIFMQDLKKVDSNPVSYDLSPGDAVIYKGCDVTHWREKMFDANNFTVQFHLHYVDLDGARASYKYDKRPGLGYSRN